MPRSRCPVPLYAARSGAILRGFTTPTERCPGRFAAVNHASSNFEYDHLRGTLCTSTASIRPVSLAHVAGRGWGIRCVDPGGS